MRPAPRAAHGQALAQPLACLFLRKLHPLRRLPEGGELRIVGMPGAGDDRRAALRQHRQRRPGRRLHGALHARRIEAGAAVEPDDVEAVHGSKLQLRHGDAGERSGDGGELRHGTDRRRRDRRQCARALPIGNERVFETLRADGQQPLAAMLPDQPAHRDHVRVIEHVDGDERIARHLFAGSGGGGIAQVDAVDEPDGLFRLPARCRATSLVHRRDGMAAHDRVAFEPVARARMGRRRDCRRPGSAPHRRRGRHHRRPRSPRMGMARSTAAPMEPTVGLESSVEKILYCAIDARSPPCPRTRRAASRCIHAGDFARALPAMPSRDSRRAPAARPAAAARAAGSTAAPRTPSLRAPPPNR